VRTILIIDDSETVRVQLQRAFAEADYEVIEAENGRLGLEALKDSKDKIDIVLCDVNMPEMDGLEMVRLVHLDDVLKDIPILMLTTEASKASKEIGKDAGVVAWITKPFKSEKVLSAVERVLKRKKKG
tara:strand:- start:126 stop:509 length:384 start_codon:yes stop_codon:yes gene_type:complete